MSKSVRPTIQILSDIILLLTIAMILFLTSITQAEWYKGAIHQHSFWSDGNAFPEEVAAQYKDLGYHFVATSEHNVLQQGECWISVTKLKERCGDQFEKLVEKCEKRFGHDWFNFQGSGDTQAVQLKTFDQISAKLNEPNRFLYVWAEETDQKPEGKNLHLNYINLAKWVAAPKAEGKTSTIIENGSAQVEVARNQEKEFGRSILLQLNHPSWPEYDISAENIADIRGLNFMEVWNMGGECKLLCDGKSPSCEKIWDVANTIRIQNMQQNPLYGTATDDCHNYIFSDLDKTQPGRGFIVVQSEKLEANALVEAMKQGKFYASTGVMLKNITFNPTTKTFRVEVEPKPNTKYTIEFIGTRRDVSTKPTPDRYSPKIGEVFKKVGGTSAEYQMAGSELYVRAAIRSDRKQDRPFPQCDEIQTEQALTQPVGWDQ